MTSPAPREALPPPHPPSLSRHGARAWTTRRTGGLFKTFPPGGQKQPKEGTRRAAGHLFTGEFIGVREGEESEEHEHISAPPFARPLAPSPNPDTLRSPP